MADLEVIRFRPEPAQYAWTFGGTRWFLALAGF
jgi:hypothetical protein